MELVKKSQSIKLTPTLSTTIWEFPTNDTTISGALAQIKGKYPETGYVLNEVSYELVYVVSGSGRLVMPEKTVTFNQGDQILLVPNEKYRWEGNFTIFMATAPKFEPQQHKVLEE